jgi:predicted GTPase
MTSHQQEPDALLETLDSLASLATQHGFDRIVSKTTLSISKFRSTQFIITVVGEFNRGKSTLINALLGIDLLPTGILPTTASIHLIHYADEPSISVHNRNGNVAALPFSKDALNKYVADANFDSSTVNYIAVGYPLEYLKDGIVIVDTPGVNDIDEQRIAITYGYLPQSDAIVFLFSANTPLKMTEKEFLTEHILINNIPKLFFVVNHIDALGNDEVKDSMSSLNENLRAILNVQDVKLYPLSAKQASKGRIQGDTILEEKSGIITFENDLKEFVMGGSRMESRITAIKSTIGGLCTLFLDEISASELQLNCTVDELLQMRKNIESTKPEYDKKFDKLSEYIDNQVDNLLTRIEGSLIKKQKEVVEQMLFQIDKSRSDLSEFAEKDVPYAVRQSLKKWAEQSHPFIEQNESAIVRKTSEGFQRVFSRAPILQMLQGNAPTLDDIERFSLSTQSSSQDVSKASFTAGAAALGLVAVISGAGMLPLIMSVVGGGSLGQRFVGQYFTKKEVERQKVELRETIPGYVEKAFLGTAEAIRKNLTISFDSMKKSLMFEYASIWESIQADLNTKLKSVDEKQGSVDQKKVSLTSLRTKLETIRTNYIGG